VPHAGQRERAVVVHLRQAEPAVLLGHLHPERADALQAVDDRGGDLRVTLDLKRIDLRLEEFAQAREKPLAFLNGRRVEPRLRVDQIEAEVPEKQFIAEARQLPLGLACCFGDLASLPL
jgi:hypothetical protein